jgi:excisionase family DNA binding protein
VNAKEAALLLGVHYKTILNMINDGRLAASKNDSGDWVISESDLAAREQEIGDKEFATIYTHMAVQIIEKAHNRAIQAAREELIDVARATIKVKENRNELNQQVKRLQNALDAYKAAEAFTLTVDSIKKQAEIESHR